MDNGTWALKSNYSSCEPILEEKVGVRPFVLLFCQLYTLQRKGNTVTPNERSQMKRRVPMTCYLWASNCTIKMFHTSFWLDKQIHQHTRQCPFQHSLRANSKPDVLDVMGL